METFQTQQSETSNLYIKIEVKSNSVIFSQTTVKLFPGGKRLAHSSNPGNGSIPPNSSDWIKLDKTKDLKGKEISINTFLSKTENVDIISYLVEDDDGYSPVLKFAKFKSTDIINNIARLQIKID